MRFRVIAVVGCLLISAASAAEPKLISHWPLTSDARDASGNNRHGTAQAVEFAATGAAFNGRSSRIDVADAPQLATDDFSISLWVHTEAQLDDAVGDLISQYDSATRTGLNLSIKHHAGGKWTDLGAPWKSNGVTAMASYNGHLYVGVSRVLLHYSGLKPTIAHHIGGKVFRYEGGQWVDLGQLLGLDGVQGIAEFRGKLYVTGFYQPALYRYEGGEKWTALGSPGGMRPEALCVHNGALSAEFVKKTAMMR